MVEKKNFNNTFLPNIGINRLYALLYDACSIQFKKRRTKVIDILRDQKWHKFELAET